MNHCEESVLIRSFSGPNFPAFRLNRQRYSVSLCIRSEYEKIGTRKTPSTDTFHPMNFKAQILQKISLVVYVYLELCPTSTIDPFCEKFHRSRCSTGFSIRVCLLFLTVYAFNSNSILKFNPLIPDGKIRSLKEH